MDVTHVAYPGVSYETIYKILHEDFGLLKKSARWVPKLLPQNVAVVGDWFAADAIQCLILTLYMSDLTPPHFFLLPHIKEALAACTWIAKSLKTATGLGSPPPSPKRRRPLPSGSSMSIVFNTSS